MQASSAAREDLDQLQALLRCSLDALAQVLQAGGRNGIFGFSRDRRRWGEDSVAPQAKWRVLVDFWVSGEGCWRVKLGWEGLWRELVDEVIFGQKKV